MAPSNTHLIVSDSTFNNDQKALLAALAGLMIPAADDLPSAADPVIFADIVHTLATHSDIVSQALETLARNSIASRTEPFASLDSTMQMALVGALRDEAPAFMRVFESAVATCYYRDDRVLFHLGLAAGAPFPRGNVVEATDWTLLDPVRQRQPFFRIP